MKQQIEQLIEELAPYEFFNRHTCGELSGCDGCEKEIVKGRQKLILIGDVLERMCKLESHVLFDTGSSAKVDDKKKRLLALWLCHFKGDQSLQEIFGEVEWEIDAWKHAQDCDNHDECPGLRPKQQSHRELFEFLLSLDLNQKQDE